MITMLNTTLSYITSLSYKKCEKELNNMTDMIYTQKTLKHLIIVWSNWQINQ